MADEVVRGRVEADVSGYKRGMEEAARATDDFRKKAEASARGGVTTLQAVMESLGRSLPLVSGGMAGVALAAVGLARSAASTAAEMGRMAAEVGVSAEEMSRYSYAARILNVDTGALKGGLSSLTKAIETDAAALKAMGVATRDAAGVQRPLRDVLGDVAERFATYEGSAAQATLGQAVFGDSWKKLQPLIEKGRTGLADLTNEASTFGTVIDDEAAAAAEAFEEDVRRLQSVLPGLAQTLAGPVVSALGDVIEEFNAARRAGLSFLEMMGGTIFNGMADPTKTLQAKIAERRAEIEQIRSGPWYQNSMLENLAPDKAVAQLEQEIKYLEELERVQARAAKAAEQRGTAAQTAGQAAAAAAAAALEDEKNAAREREKSGRDRERAAAAAEKAAARATAEYQRNAAALDALIDRVDAQAMAEAEAAVRSYDAAWAQHLNGLDEQRRGLEEQVELYGLTEAQIAAVTLRRAEETLEVARANGVAADYLAALEREVALRREIAGAAGTLEAKRANAEAAQTAAREWERTAQEIEGAIYDAIVGGGQDAGEVLERTFKALVLRPIIQPIAQAAAGVVQGALGFGQSGASGGSGGLGGFGLPPGVGGNLLGSGALWAGGALGAGTTLGGFMTGFGTALTSGAGTLGSMSAGASLMGTAGGGATGAGMMLGAALPWIAGGLALANVFGLFDKKPSDKSAWAKANPLNGEVFGVGSMTGKKDPGQEARDATAQLAQFLVGFAADARIDRTLTVMTGARDGFRVDLTGGLRSPTAPRGNGGYGYNFGAVGEDAMRRILNDLVDEGALPQKTIDAWRQMRTDAAGVARDAQEQMDVLDLLVKGINQAEIERANTMQQAGESLAAAYARMVAVEEGIRAAIGSTFDTPAERLEQVFKALKVAIPETLDEYEAMVRAQDLTTEAGREMAVSLLEAKGLWEEVRQDQDGVVEAARQVWERLRDGLEDFRADLTGGALARLSPEDAYAAAKERWRDTSRLARLGNEDAISSLEEVGRALLDASLAFNAGSVSYYRDRDLVLSAVDNGIALTGRKLESPATAAGAVGGARIEVATGGALAMAKGAAEGGAGVEPAASSAGAQPGVVGNADAVRELQAVVRVLSSGLSSIDRRLANLERSGEEQARAARLAADRRNRSAA